MKNLSRKSCRNFTLRLIKVLAFILIFALTLELLSSTVFSKRAATQYKNILSKSYGYITEPKNSIDIALIGSSNLYSGFIPIKVWEDYGYTSTVISTPKQTVERSYAFLEDVLKTQSPKLVVIETDMFYADIPIKNSEGKIQNDALRQLKKIANSIRNSAFGDDLENHFTIFMFHDSWKNLKKNAFIHSLRTHHAVSCEHGYNFNKIICPIEDNDRMTITHNTEPITNENLKYINKIIDSCHSKNIKLMFIEMPSLTSWNYSRHNTVNRLAQKYNIPFFDLNIKSNFDKSGIDYANDFRDTGEHLNYYGAKKATDFFTKEIINTYGNIFIDKRNITEFKYWQQSAEEFKEKYNIE